MRVLLTVPSLSRDFGGPTVKARRLAVELRALGHDVRLIGAGPTGDGAEGLPLRSRFHGTPIPGRLGTVAAIVRGADVVHAMGLRDPVSTTACLVARRAGVTYVVEPAGMHRRRLRSVQLKGVFDRIVGTGLLEGAAAVVATSSLEAAELAEDGVDPSCIVTRPNGVDVDALQPLPERGSFRRQHGVPDDAPLVLSLGRIAKKKGLVTLAEALARVPGAWGAVVGPDDGDGALADLLSARERLGLRRLVVVSRELWDADKAQAFADADAFCLASSTENFGNAPAEAAAVGMPVVVSAQSGVVEFLDPAATSVVDHDDTASVARGIERALRPEVRTAASAGAPTLRRSLAWAGMAEQQERIYSEAIANRRERTLGPRVLLTVPTVRRTFGGPALQVFPFADSLRARGLQVQVVACEARGSGAIDLGSMGSFHGTPIPRRVVALRAVVRRSDLVHVMGFRDPVGTLAALLAHRSGVPLVVEPMGMHRRRVRSVHIKTMFDHTLGAVVMRRADVVVATSSLERDELLSDGVLPGRIVTRPNGIDLDPPGDLSPRGSFRLEQGIPAEAPLVLFLGRITRKKGLPDLVEAISGMPDVWLAVVGPDDGDGTLELVRSMVSRLAMRDRVCVDPRGRWGDERGALLADVDAFCLPSETENFGNTPAEAAALGIPVVVSDRCGVAEYLPPGAHRVVPWADVDALRAGLEWALRPGGRAAAAAVAGDLRSRFTWTRVAEEQDMCYRRLLG